MDNLTGRRRQQLRGIVYPFMVPRLISSNDFPAAVRWTVLMQSILLIIANMLVSTPFEPKGWQKKESVGLHAFKSWPCIAFVLGCFFVMWDLLAPLNYLPEMAAQAGIPLQLAQYTVAIANAGSMIGRIVPGFLSDRLRQFNMTYFFDIIGCARPRLLASAYILSIGCWYYYLCASFGFASGGFVSLDLPCVVELAEGKVEEIGVKLGGFCLAIALGALTGPPIEGTIRDQGGPSQGFVGLMIYTGVVLVVDGTLTSAARVLRGGRSLTKKI